MSDPASTEASGFPFQVQVLLFSTQMGSRQEEEGKVLPSHSLRVAVPVPSASGAKLSLQQNQLQGDTERK